MNLATVPEPKGKRRHARGDGPKVGLGSIGELQNARALDWFARVAVLIDDEADRYELTSPILRGPNEVSHALMRIISSDAFAALANENLRMPRALRPSLCTFIEDALEQHARDRGQVYATEGRAVRELVGQLEIWARELLRGTADPRRVRVALQLALTEELASNLVKRR